MTDKGDDIPILPYSLIVGQEELRHALEIAYVSRLGLLATGQRGTAKSTTIRAFSMMAYEKLPVTLPIGATDDRVLGGWSVDALLAKNPEPTWQKGLLEQATAAGLLYVDEINLLDDHVVNLVLDAAATEILTVQRENADRPTRRVKFSLVGSMNPDEGPLRPQLLDRFAMVVTVDSEGKADARKEILRTLLEYDLELEVGGSNLVREGRARDAELRSSLERARERYATVTCPDNVVDACAALAADFRLVGHRGDIVMLRAARGVAALQDEPVVATRHLQTVAKFALIHRRPGAESGTLRRWTEDDDQRVRSVLVTAVAE